MTLARRTGVDLTALIGSRICHDLISPLGAIGNGVELLTMAGGTSGPELALISESVENANSRIRFFRIAFGAAPEGSVLGRAEILEALNGQAKGGRQTILWQIDMPQDRRLVKLAFLCLQCLETALPWGGLIKVQTDQTGWTLTAEAGKIRSLDPLWRVFESADSSYSLTPAEIQFALAPIWAADIGWRLIRQATPTRLNIEFRPI